MFIIPTTTAILIAFVALLAWSEVRNRLAKGRRRRRDLETPGSPTIPVTTEVKPPLGHEEKALSPTKEPVNKELESHKLLYYKLHNLEYHPDILPECRELLTSLLSETLVDASKEPDSGKFSVQTFSHDALDKFLKTKDVDVTDRWEEYLARRKAGGGREMFGDIEEGKWWLKQAAPVKSVDGAWLGHINNITTPFMFRSITKNAWQVMSEELGDGDLAKNHVHVYQNLTENIDAGLPAADSEDFIHPRHGMNEARCWKAAVVQLLISLFPHDFLPEALGFNMAYESLPLHLLKTVKELRELRLNPYYFELHISIDNADSGHAAMAMAAVANYIDVIAQTEGEGAAFVAWRRVQAGYILAEGLPTTPESSSLKEAADEPFPRTKIEAALIEIFAAKTFVAHKIHCNSRLRIGRRSLVDWLDPNAFKNPQWQKEFLHDLSSCKPWVIKGSSEKSRLVREMSWEGKMFGSFTQTEVDVVKAWIEELGSSPQNTSPRPDATAYLAFTQRDSSFLSTQPTDLLAHYPILNTPEPHNPFLPSPSTITIAPPSFNLANLNRTSFIPLFLISPTLLSTLPSLPMRAASPTGSALIRVLRAQTGFNDEGHGVAGMDEVRRTNNHEAVGIVELGLTMCSRAGLGTPACLEEVVAMGHADTRAFAEWMVWMGMRWLSHRDLLVGISWGWMEVHEVLATDVGSGLLSEDGREVMERIAARERAGLEVCKREVEMDDARSRRFWEGVGIVRRAVEACCHAGSS